MSNILSMAQAAKRASVAMATVSTEAKNAALLAMADILQSHQAEILQANARDMAAAEADGLAQPVLKRLKFDARKLADVIAGLHSLVSLPDPVGRLLAATELDTDLILHKVSCPIGVIGIVFEARPDALVQISSLCLKSGNAVLLKGGKEARESNRLLADLITQATQQAGLPQNWLQLLETREEVGEMLKLDAWIDLLIPRGSNAFVKYIMTNTNIPVLGHADGLCHVYVDAEADIDKACRIIVDSKTQYVSACNAAETMLVHADIARNFLPAAAQALREAGVQLRGCDLTQKIIDCQPATDEDWQTEYLDLILSIKVVPDLDTACQHINTYGSRHTDVIVTENAATATRFQLLVDSADVFWNCSSRFADGFRFGLGAEVGISTSKIHARGPVGLEGLVIYKWLLQGNGHIVADYASGKAHFTHKKLQ